MKREKKLRLLAIFAACCVLGTLGYVMLRPANVTELEGKWIHVETEIGGEKMTHANQVGRTFGQTGEGTMSLFVRGHEIIYSGLDKRKETFWLYPEMSPKGIDVFVEGQTRQGIYSLDGDELRICGPQRSVNPPSRPTEFKTHQGDGLVMTVWKRQ
jgi:uncharacterized protein (TIGR03067 family)